VQKATVTTLNNVKSNGHQSQWLEEVEPKKIKPEREREEDWKGLCEGPQRTV
jgi:hypothetical protein